MPCDTVVTGTEGRRWTDECRRLVGPPAALCACHNRVTWHRLPPQNASFGFCINCWASVSCDANERAAFHLLHTNLRA